jgi:hypothetical protein
MESSRLPADAQTGGYLTRDGHGGIWLSAFKGGKGWLWDYRNGRWSQTPDPVYRGEEVGPAGLMPIPNTTSVWAVGGIEPTPDPHGFFQAVVVKFGR